MMSLFLKRTVIIWCLLLIITFQFRLISICQCSVFISSEVLDNKTSKIISLSSISHIDTIEPGVYQSDNIESILSFALSKFGEKDLVVFDIDQTLTTRLVPHNYAQQIQESRFLKKLRSKSSFVKKGVEAYALFNLPSTLMDEKIPDLILKLQEKKVRCISNTATSPILSCSKDIDVSMLRVKYLHDLGIDFSQSFPDLQKWNFCIDGNCVVEGDYIQNEIPLFKRGVIFSAFIPKYVTLLELLKKIDFTPKRVVFVDDFVEHCTRMHEGLTLQGIETYSFVYSKINHTCLLDYFSSELAMHHITGMEYILDALINEEVQSTFDTSSLFPVCAIDKSECKETSKVVVQHENTTTLAIEQNEEHPSLPGLSLKIQEELSFPKHFIESIPLTIHALKTQGSESSISEIITDLLSKHNAGVWHALSIEDQRMLVSKIECEVAYPKVSRVGLISTMPKSGTLYMMNVLWCYSQFLEGKTIDLMPREQYPFLLNGISARVYRGGHWEAPGYRDIMSTIDPLYSSWSNLRYYADPLDTGIFSPLAPHDTNPYENTEARIIHVYRKPLDQFWSWYNYVETYFPENYKQFIRSGESFKIETLEDSIFEASSLKSYIKRWHTFKVMADHFPQNFFLIKYDELMSYPKQKFKEMLTFLGSPIVTQLQEDALAAALGATNLTKLKKDKEKYGDIGRAFHITDGRSNTGEQHISSQNIERIEAEFKRFGYSLADFD